MDPNNIYFTKQRIDNKFDRSTVVETYYDLETGRINDNQLRPMLVFPQNRNDPNLYYTEDNKLLWISRKRERNVEVVRGIDERKNVNFFKDSKIDLKGGMIKCPKTNCNLYFTSAEACVFHFKNSHLRRSHSGTIILLVFYFLVIVTFVFFVLRI